MLRGRCLFVETVGLSILETMDCFEGNEFSAIDNLLEMCVFKDFFRLEICYKGQYFEQLCSVHVIGGRS